MGLAVAFLSQGGSWSYAPSPQPSCRCGSEHLVQVADTISVPGLQEVGPADAFLILGVPCSTR